MVTSPKPMSKEDLIEFAKTNAGKLCQGRFSYDVHGGHPVIRGKLIGYSTIGRSSRVLIEREHDPVLTEEELSRVSEEPESCLFEKQTKNCWYVDSELALCMTDEERAKLKEQLARELMGWEP